MTLRLILVAHAPTQATFGAAFPLDEPVVAERLEEVAPFAGSVGEVDAAWTSPTRRAIETAAALGLAAEAEPAIRDLDVGRWAGRTLEAVSAEEPAGLEAWTRDPGQAPHGGESIDGLFGRIAHWMERVAHNEGRAVAVTHAAVIRAVVILALRADRRAFWRIDISPLSVTEFHVTDGRWSVCCVNARPGHAR